MSHRSCFCPSLLWVLGVGGSSLNATLSDSAQQSTRGPPGVPTREFIVMLTFLPPVAFARGAARRPKSQATEATCAGHFELSNIDDESYWNHRSFADLIN